MPRVKCVVGALRPLGKTADPSIRSQGMEPIPPSGDQFVRIGLVSHIPDNFVQRGIKHIMKGDGQLNRPKTGGQVSTGFGGGFNDLLSNFSGKIFELFQGQSLKIRRTVDLV